MAGELRSYIWYYCCLAIPRDATGLRKSLSEFLAKGELFSHREPGNAPKAIAGYSGFAGSIWVRPYQWTKKRLGEKDEAGKFLYPSQRLRDYLSGFPRSAACDDWRADNRARELDEDEYEVLRAIAGSAAPTRMTYEGVVLVGSGEKRGITWIGVREQHRYAALNASEINRRLAWPEDIIRPAVDETPPSKLASAVGTFRYGMVAFEGLAADLVTSWVGESDLAKKARTVALAGARSRHDHERSLRDVLGKLAEQPTRQRATRLLVITDLEFAAAEDLCFDVLPVIKGIRNLRFVVFGREQLDVFIARRPWIWSKYFGRESSFRVFVADQTTLSSITIPEPESLLPWVEREEVDQIDSDTSAVLLFGRPGTGKSAALRHLASTLDHTVIITDWERTRAADLRDEKLIVGIIQDVSSTGQKVAVVLDDIDLPARATLFRNLVAQNVPAKLLATASHRIAEAGIAAVSATIRKRRKVTIRSSEQVLPADDDVIDE